jgi:hypothetical protein
MKMNLKPVFLALGLCSAGAVFAAATPAVPADAPAGTTGMCKDGSFSSNATKKGACKGHKGVKEWYAAAPAKEAKDAASKEAKEAKSSAKSAATAATAPAAAAAASAPAAAAAAAAPAAAAASKVPAAAAPGGGPGLVWVNTSSKVYHCSGDQWYGKTKQGEYMSEADAKAKGNRAEHGKACS